MPLDPSDFPVVVQVAFFIFGLLEDNWDGMSGSFLGKKWGNIEYLFKLYEIEEPRTMLYILKVYEGILVVHKAEQAERKRKADERKSSAGGGKNFTHNVKG
jgi:hypothetical protein|tara:strand:- start:66 stop:368 length:303 start_codon:yes stop_codon:yes gene_type:complete